MMQATKFLAPQNIVPTFKIGNLGNGGKIVTLPAPTSPTTNNNGIGKITTLPVTTTTQNTGNNNAGTISGTPGKVVSMPVTIGKSGSTVDVKPVNVQTQNNPIRINNGVKLGNNPVNKVQVQNSVQNNRPQFNAMGNGGSNNVRQSMIQSNGGNNHRSFMH